MDYILIFKNTHSALYCERVLNEVNIDIKIIPSPSNISKSCGLSIGVNCNDLEKVKNVINDQGVEIKCIYDNKKKLIIDYK